MGMFDEIKIKVLLPVELGVCHREHWFQTKSLGSYLQYYEVREDGTLWRMDYEPTEDILTCDGELAEARATWAKCEITGEIRFYTQKTSIGAEDKGQSFSGWIEFSAYFVSGAMQSLTLVIDRDGPPS